MTQGLRYPHLLILAMIMVFPYLATSQGLSQAIFIRNLFLGSRGEDVFQLQKTLNKSLETQIANTGPGSPGQETSYFGSLTKNAVIRLQNKFKAEVLVPVGLSQGTGFVGPRTLLKLNQLVFSPKSVSGWLDKPVEKSVVTQSVKIDRITPELGPSGTVINIYGEGFTKENNTLHNIFDSVYGLSSSDGKVISWKVEEPTISLTQSEIDQYLKDSSGNYFKLTSKDEGQALLAGLKNVVQPVMFYIENANGSSNVFIFQRTF